MDSCLGKFTATSHRDIGLLILAEGVFSIFFLLIFKTNLISIRGCMVKIEDYLVRLGGAQQSFDHLNAGPALEYLKTTKLNKVVFMLNMILHVHTVLKANDGLLLDWSHPLCPVTFSGYMHHCLTLPHVGNTHRILAIGGQVNKI